MTFEIRKLGPDEKIVENGFYEMPLSRHHSQPCDGVSVTSGVLRQMENATPADVWAFHQLNPNRWERTETDALRLGAAMAYVVEGGEEALLRHFKVHPADKPRRPTEAQNTAYDEGRASEAAITSVEYWRAVDSDPDRVDGVSFGWLDAAEFEQITAMGRILMADPGAQAALGGVPEVTMACRDEETGLWLLARPDTVNFDGTVSDFKKQNTQGKPFSARLVDHRITEHGYDMQLAFAAEVFERLTGNWPGMAAIVAQCDKPPYHVILREIADEDLRMGQHRNRRAIRRFAECLESGDWPGPGEHVGAYIRPEWHREMILNQMQIEGVAP